MKTQNNTASPYYITGQMRSGVNVSNLFPL